MAGFLAEISITGKPDRDKFDRALERQKFRGTDFTEVQEIADMALLGANCSLIGNKAQSKRIGSHGNSWVVYDGEIYNHRELANDLIKTYGVNLNADDVADILACGLAKESTNFLPKINGPFGLCFFDAAEKRSMFARDIIGIKSPYLYHDAENWIATSDMASLADYAKLKLNKNYMYRMAFLDHFTGFENAETVFENVIMPSIGGYIVIDERGKILKQDRFDRLDFTTKIADPSRAEREFEPLIENVFGLETEIPAKTGILMSGGIDSTTIMALSSRHILAHQKRIPVYTYSFTQKGEDEDYVATQKVLAQLRKEYGDVYDLENINLDPEITEADFERTVRARTAPILDVREIMYVKLYEYASKQNVKVMLNGMGSDELYYGYYPLDYWMSIFYRKGNFAAEEVLRYYKEQLNALRMTVYTEEFKKAAEDCCRAWLNQKFDEMPAIDEQPKKVTYFLTETINPALLLREEKGGAFSGIEVRFPLANPTLAKYGSEVDYKIHLINTNSGRHLLRKTIEDRFDSSLVNREKHSGPKKRHYWDELHKIYESHRDEILDSAVLRTIYRKEFLENPDIVRGKKDYVIYGNENDIFLEMLGWFFFARKFGI